jgi:signal transduction histidine kinase
LKNNQHLASLKLVFEIKAIILKQKVRKIKMIKKLSQRIFLLIMISLSTLIIGVIILFAILNYNNTINSRVSMMDRFAGENVRKNDEQKPPEENEKEIIELDIEGVYNIIIENSKVIQSYDVEQNKTIEEYALKLSEKNKETGIIGNYVFKVRRAKDNRIYVTLMEDENAVLQIQKIIGFSVILSIISIFIIYGVAKKSSQMIVNPVKETFEKQKQFISDASHELKTPLAVIEANADVLENDVGKNKWLTYIQTEVESMNKLINELLLLAKIENVDELKNYKDFDMSKETEIIVSMFESMAYEKNILLKCNLQDGIIINGNKEDIEHIVSTLVDNAIKHTENSKEVIVELSKDKNNIILQVKNIGQPIPENEREKIFERFYRIDKSRNRSEKRYGLGLAIAKSTIQKYNGDIEVSYKNGFTIFKVTIPI